MMTFKFLFIYMSTRVFILKYFKAMNFKNDLAQAKSEPWYKFIIWSSSPASGYIYKRVDNNVPEIAVHPC